jgi:hypothetical protein
MSGSNFIISVATCTLLHVVGSISEFIHSYLFHSRHILHQEKSIFSSIMGNELDIMYISVATDSETKQSALQVCNSLNKASYFYIAMPQGITIDEVLAHGSLHIHCIPSSILRNKRAVLHMRNTGHS